MMDVSAQDLLFADEGDGVDAEADKMLRERLESYLERSGCYWVRDAVVRGEQIDYMSFSPHGGRADAASIERGTFTCYRILTSIDQLGKVGDFGFSGDENFFVCPPRVAEAMRAARHVPRGGGKRWRAGVLTFEEGSDMPEVVREPVAVRGSAAPVRCVRYAPASETLWAMIRAEREPLEPVR